jgi:hypothetical protein
MRNAGDGTPGGSTGRRQRATAPEATGRPAGNGGASLFTPAYRVRHAAAVPSSNAPRTGDADYGIAAAGQPGTGYRWSELDQPSASYQQAGYSSSRMGSAWDDELAGGGYSWMSNDSAEGSAWPSYARPDTGGRRLANAIRGFAPVPDEPLPTYPPGPFAAWNRSPSDRSEPDRPGPGNGSDFDLPGQHARDPSARNPRRESSSRSLSAATITPDEFDTNHGLPAIKDPVLTARSAVQRTTTGGSRTGADHRTGRSSRRAAPARGRSGPSRGTRGTPRTNRRSKRQPVRLAVVAAVVIIAAVAAILVITSIGKPTSNSGAGNKSHTPGRSASPTPTKPGGKWGYIGTRATDPTPLTVHEVFPITFITAGVYFHASITELGHNCRTALIGAALQGAVKKAGCSQVLRASYVARDDNAMATIGVFNLANSTVASSAALHMGQSAFVAPLAAKNGVTSKIGQGTGLEEAVVKGHYLVLVWAEKVDLGSPRTKWQRQRLTAFMNTLIGATANRGLSYRMVDGKP